MPSEPAESNFKNKVQAVAYPCVERNGVVWTYMGTRAADDLPPLPDIEPNMLAGQADQVQKVLRDCNWMQGLEGDIDTSHLAYLHLGAVKPEDATPGTFDYYTVADRAPRYDVHDTDFGTSYGAYRPAEADTYYWRVAHFLFPFYTMIPTGVLGVQVLVRAWVPIDDDHMMFWSFAVPAVALRPGRLRESTPRPAAAPRSPRRPARPAGRAPTRRHAVPAGDARTGWASSASPRTPATTTASTARRSAHASYTGIPGIHQQDQAITESMGTIYDRNHEHLGTSDAMVIRTRRRLVNAAKALDTRRHAASWRRRPDHLPPCAPAA